jgi:hypothetical protein
MAGCGGKHVHLGDHFLQAARKGDLTTLDLSKLSRGERRVALELGALAQRDREFHDLNRRMDYANLRTEESNDELAIRNDELDRQIAQLKGASSRKALQQENLDRQKLFAAQQAIALYQSEEIPVRGALAVLGEMSSMSDALDSCHTVVRRMLSSGEYTLQAPECRNVTWKDTQA